MKRNVNSSGTDAQAGGGGQADTPPAKTAPGADQPDSSADSAADRGMGAKRPKAKPNAKAARRRGGGSDAVKTSPPGRGTSKAGRSARRSTSASDLPLLDGAGDASDSPPGAVGAGSSVGQSKAIDEAGPASPRLTAASKNDLAVIYGLSVRTIELSLASGAPAKTAAGYDLAQWGAWFRDQRPRHRGGSGAGSGSAEDWALRKDRAQALLAEEKLSERMQMYCLREQVDRAAARDFTTLRLHLETLADRTAALVPDELRPQVLDAARDTVATALTSMRAALARWSDETNEDPVADALQALHKHLGRMASRIKTCVRGEKNQKRVADACRLWAAMVRQAMADASAAESNRGRSRSGAGDV